MFNPLPADILRRPTRCKLDPYCLMTGRLNESSWPVKIVADTLRDERRAAGRNANNGKIKTGRKPRP